MIRRFLRTRLGLILALLVVLSLGLGMGFGIWRDTLDAPGPATSAQDVVIPHGGLTDVAETLARAGVISSPTLFRIAALVTRGAPLRAEEFSFPASASMRAVLAVLRTGKPVEHHITIPEGITAAQIALLLDRADALTGDDPLPAEGAVMPSTYNYERGATRNSVVQRATAAMTHNLAQLWADRAPGLPLQTPHQALILASIVERETALPEERPRVAAVFINRLRLGMRLQSDPTVAYASSGGLGGLGRPLTRADLEDDNPYNTYRIAGLPPAPIASPGLAALRAVLHPAETDELYFVADGGGGHAFARTLDEHVRNVTRARAAAK